MKKTLSVVLCLGLLSINLASYATEISPVKINCTNVPLKTTLNVKYSAYRIDYINEGQNPVRVNDVKCYNRVPIADYFSGEYKMTKKTKICYLLALPTLGLSSLVAMPDIMKNSTGALASQNEARRFNAFDLTANESTNLKTSNEILGQGQSLQFNVLVPLNEKPEIVGTFEDTVAHKYIRVEAAK